MSNMTDWSVIVKKTVMSLEAMAFRLGRGIRGDAPNSATLATTAT
jgi:hypothetical protein